MTAGRTFTTFHSIRLPRLDINNALSLGRAVLSAAEGMPLSDGAREAIEDVATALEIAREAAATRKLPGPVEARLDSRKADINLDAAWGSTHGFLTAWAKLPNEPKAPLASGLRDRLFPDGLKFTQVAFKRQWAESNTRLALIDEEGLEASFDALGGGPFLDALRTTHRAYGDALGITKAQERANEEPNLRAVVAQLTDALRGYVLQVTAMVRKSDPKSTAIAGRLLAPIENWGTPPVRKGGGPPFVTEEGESASCGEAESE